LRINDFGASRSGVHIVRQPDAADTPDLSNLGVVQVSAIALGKVVLWLDFDQNWEIGQVLEMATGSAPSLPLTVQYFVPIFKSRTPTNERFVTPGLKWRVAANPFAKNRPWTVVISTQNVVQITGNLILTFRKCFNIIYARFVWFGRICKRPHGSSYKVNT
jgi:hypothetical protein